MTSTQSYTTTGSKKLISGTFGLIPYLNAVLDAYPEALVGAIKDITSEETGVLKDSMTNHPDWSPYADKAHASYEDGQLHYGLQGLSSDEETSAHALEYGNPVMNVTATGLLRSVAANRTHDTDLGSAIANRLEEML